VSSAAPFLGRPVEAENILKKKKPNQTLPDLEITSRRVRVSDAALVAAARLADRYITQRFLPDKVRRK
jgi:ATP-dependent Clp protease ATP-binding subunit ClpA